MSQCADCGHSHDLHVSVGPCRKRSSDYGGDCFCPRFIAPKVVAAATAAPNEALCMIDCGKTRDTFRIARSHIDPTEVFLCSGFHLTVLRREEAITAAMALLKFAFAENSMKPPVPTPAPGEYDDIPF